MSSDGMSPGRPDNLFLVWNYFSVYVSGLFTWELAMTFDFDWSFFSGRRKFKWPLFPYFLCRYSFLGSLITFHIFEFGTDKRVDCQVLYTCLGIFSNFAVASASVCLAIRAVAIWMRNRIILVLIAVPCLVQWALILRDIARRHAIRDPVSHHCLVVRVPLPDLLLLYVPAMVFDFLVMVISAIGLFKQGPLRSKLQLIIFRHGLIYFIVTFALNSLPVAFILAPVALTVTLVSTTSATFATTVVSCRLVRDLVLFAEDEDRRHEDLNTTSEGHRFHNSIATSDTPILSTVLISAGKSAASQNSGNSKTICQTESNSGSTLPV